MTLSQILVTIYQWSWKHINKKWSFNQFQSILMILFNIIHGLYNQYLIIPFSIQTLRKSGQWWASSGLEDITKKSLHSMARQVRNVAIEWSGVGFGPMWRCWTNAWYKIETVLTSRGCYDMLQPEWLMHVLLFAILIINSEGKLVSCSYNAILSHFCM